MLTSRIGNSPTGRVGSLSPRNPPSSRGVFFAWAFAAILIALAATPNALLVTNFSQPGVDFYQMWGVPKSLRSSQYTLGTPYGNTDAYHRQLSVIAAASSDVKLQVAFAIWPQLDLDHTPLLYYFFGLLPNHYSTALFEYRCFEIVAFVAAMMLIVWQLSGSLWLSLLAGLTALPGCDAAVVDLMLANVDSVQLVLVAIPMAAIEAARRKQSGLNLPLVLALMAMLAAGILAKPNIAGACSLLMLCVLMNCKEARIRRVGILGSILIGAVLVALPCVLFGTLKIWPEWLAHFSTASEQASWGGPQKGNYSAIKYLAGLQIDAPASTLLMALVTLLPLSGAALLSRLKTPVQSPGMRSTSDMLKDPYLCYTVGLIVLFAISPLVWLHYFLLYIPACCWLILDSRHSWFARCAGLVALLLVFDAPGRLTGVRVGMPGSMLPTQHLLTWVPIWLGVVDVVFRWRQQ